MASIAGYLDTQHTHSQMYELDGYVQTDASGKVKSQASGLTALADGYLDAWGDPLMLPRGIDSITLDTGTAGLYHIHLAEPFHKVHHASVTLLDVSKTGVLSVLQWNPQSSDVPGGAKAQTIDVQYRESGSAHSLVSSGFSIKISISNAKDV